MGTSYAAGDRCQPPFVGKYGNDGRLALSDYRCKQPREWLQMKLIGRELPTHQVGAKVAIVARSALAGAVGCGQATVRRTWVRGRHWVSVGIGGVCHPQPSIVPSPSD